MKTGQSCRRTQNFAECGNTLWAVADGSELRLVCNRCHDRLCETCQRERQAAVVEGVLLKCHDAEKRLRFVTLTLKHVAAPLALQLDRLISCFKLLRSHPAVSRAMLGGVWFVEVKLDKAGNLWHPHLHVIVEGDFVQQKVLAKSWYEVTGDSYIVDIRQIDSVAERARYVAKYATKPLHSAVSLQQVKLEEFVVAIKGRRLYQCFGSWVGAVKREAVQKPAGRMVGRVDSLWRDALEGDADALGWMRRLHGQFPKLRAAFPLPISVVPREPDPP